MKNKPTIARVGSGEMVRPRRSYLYRCPACGKKYRRKSTKQWISSYCGKVGKNVRLRLVKPIDEITRTMRALKRAGRWPNK